MQTPLSIRILRVLPAACATIIGLGCASQLISGENIGGMPPSYNSTALEKKLANVPARRRVFLDIAFNNQELGRIIVELNFAEVPKTCENFRALCTHEYGFGYRGSFFHRSSPAPTLKTDESGKPMKALLIQGGDITRRDGSGGKGIYGNTFQDESFALKHTGRGIVTMANHGPDTNNSQFCILTRDAPAPWLDGEHVVFGEVVDGMEVVDICQEILLEAQAESEARAAALKVESEELGFRSQSSRSLPPTLSHMPVIIDAGELEDPVSTSESESV